MLQGETAPVPAGRSASMLLLAALSKLSGFEKEEHMKLEGNGGGVGQRKNWKGRK